MMKKNLIVLNNFYLKKEFLITKIFLIFLLIICSCSKVSKEKNFKGFLYDVINGRSITITKYIGHKSSVHIPASIDGLPVNTIGDKAFYDCKSLTIVIIPSSVTTIGDRVFYGCKRLTSVTIPSSVTSIKYNAFSLCINLTDINVETLNSAYMSIDGILFDKGGQKLIYYPRGKNGAYTIPSSVTTIEKFAFSDCDGLTSVTVPSSVTTIGNGAFSRCKNLTDINVETLNNTYMSVYGVLFEKGGQKLICYPAGKNGAYAIYSSIYSPVTDIGDMAFYYCEGLTHITIPSTITTIGDRAFYGCKSLTSVIIPSSVTTIGEYAFDDGLTLYQ